LKLARTKRWRESHGLTQRELAAEAGVGAVTVARIETGASVTPPTARKIAEALGVAVADLLERPPVPLAGASQEAGRLEEERLEAASKDPQQWERVLESVRERQREVEAKVEELVALSAHSEADPYEVKWALDEARDCADTLMLALSGSHERHSRGRDEIVIDLSALDLDQWEEWLNARRFYDDIAKSLVEVGLAELRKGTGQKAEPVPIGIGV
jgi:transcriptional regulator with XRE-family HTH domain